MGEEYIRGHRAEAGIVDCSDWFIPDNVIDDVLKPFMTEKRTSIDNSAICYLSSANHNQKADGVKEVAKWLNGKCKEQKQKVTEKEKEYVDTRHWAMYDCDEGVLRSTEIELEVEKAKLNMLVEIKISVEKYAKKLKHQGE